MFYWTFHLFWTSWEQWIVMVFFQIANNLRITHLNYRLSRPLQVCFSPTVMLMIVMTALYEVNSFLLNPFYCSGNYSRIIRSVLAILIKSIEQSDITVSNDLEGSFPDGIRKYSDPTDNRRACKELDKMTQGVMRQDLENKISSPKNVMRGKSLLIQNF